MAFIFLFFASLLMFGLPLSILDFTSQPGKEVIGDISDVTLFNLLMNQYYLALGDYDTENFKDQPYVFIMFFIFILGTFFIQVTMLNMLIAIMSDTFDRVSEQKE